MTGAAAGPLGGRVAFISGASSGIVLATARAFSRVLAPKDVAETILLFVTRPPRVTINQVPVMPAGQAITVVHRHPAGRHP